MIFFSVQHPYHEVTCEPIETRGLGWFEMQNAILPICRFPMDAGNIIPIKDIPISSFRACLAENDIFFCEVRLRDSGYR